MNAAKASKNTKEKTPLLPELTKGFLKENPVLRLVLGTCPTLAISTSLNAALGMGIAVAAVLLCANLTISLLRRVIPDKVRIPAYITIVAGIVTLVQMLVKAYAPAIDQTLGVYLPLIAVNCIIFGRVDGFASRHGLAASAFDAIGMGVGFTGALCLMAIVREFLGAGSVAGLKLGGMTPMAIMILPPGGFFVYGCLIALSNWISRKMNKPILKEEAGCAGCAGCDSCENAAEEGDCNA